VWPAFVSETLRTADLRKHRLCETASYQPVAERTRLDVAGSRSVSPRSGVAFADAAGQLVEAMWDANLKGVELANLAGDTLEEVVAAAERGIQCIGHTHHVPWSFLRYCALSL
jgi:hypothetical protein